jgi:hypothetical protein
MKSRDKHILVGVEYLNGGLAEPDQVFTQGFSVILASSEQTGGRHLDMLCDKG